MVFKGWVFLVLALTVWTQVDLTIHKVCRGSEIWAQMTEYGIICGAHCKRARQPTAYLVNITTEYRKQPL